MQFPFHHGDGEKSVGGAQDHAPTDEGVVELRDVQRDALAGAAFGCVLTVDFEPADVSTAISRQEAKVIAKMAATGTVQIR